MTPAHSLPLFKLTFVQVISGAGRPVTVQLSTALSPSSSLKLADLSMLESAVNTGFWEAVEGGGSVGKGS